MVKRSNSLSKQVGAYSLAAGAVALGIPTAAQGVMQVYDYRDNPLGASVEDNYSVWDHDFAVLYMDGTFKRSIHDGTGYTFYDETGAVTTPIDAADKTDDAIWMTHHDFMATSGKGDSGFDGAFLNAGDNGGVASNLIPGNEDGNPLYEVYHVNEPTYPADGGLEGLATQVDGALNYAQKAVFRGVGGVRTSPGWGGNSVYGDRKGFLGEGFIGFYLDMQDGRHYGWVHVGTGYRPYGITIFGWAYETVALLPVELSYDVTPATRLGDFDLDGDIDADDIDALGAAIAASSTDLTFDVDGDGDVDSDDFAFHVQNLVDTALTYEVDGEWFMTGTQFGDFNLDGEVGILDLGLLGDSYNTTSGWATGDANGDGTTGILDLGLLGDNYGFDRSAIPEPASAMLLVAGAGALLKRRRN
jgi:hypothetical protein